MQLFLAMLYFTSDQADTRTASACAVMEDAHILLYQGLYP